MLLNGIIIFIFGAVIGSFLNVVIFRMNTGMGVGGRSKCFSCGKVLSFLELIPVFSYLVLGGKCSKCKSTISIQYILVEIMTGLLFVFTWWKFFLPENLFSISVVDLSKFVLILVASCVLVVILIYDYRHKIIPDSAVFLFIGLSAVSILLDYLSLSNLWTTNDIVYRLIAGPLYWGLPFALVWKLSNGRAMGFGDAKLAFGVGWFLGVSAGFSAICLSFWLGLIAFLLLKIFSIFFRGLKSLSKTITMKSEIPFAPFIIIAFFIVLFSGFNVLDSMNLFFSSI